jgi:hypothetical protein
MRHTPVQVKGQQMLRPYTRNKSGLKIQDRFLNLQNREMTLDNKNLAKSITEIKRRKTKYGDILQQMKDGKNIYHMVGHSRSQV